MAIQYRVKRNGIWHIRATFERVNLKMQELIFGSDLEVQLIDVATGDVIADSLSAAKNRFGVGIGEIARRVA